MAQKVAVAERELAQGINSIDPQLRGLEKQKDILTRAKNKGGIQLALNAQKLLNEAAKEIRNAEMPQIKLRIPEFRIRVDSQWEQMDPVNVIESIRPLKVQGFQGGRRVSSSSELSEDTQSKISWEKFNPVSIIIYTIIIITIIII